MEDSTYETQLKLRIVTSKKLPSGHILWTSVASKSPPDDWEEPDSHRDTLPQEPQIRGELPGPNKACQRLDPRGCLRPSPCRRGLREIHSWYRYNPSAKYPKTK